jgi:hypothetical protein
MGLRMDSLYLMCERRWFCEVGDRLYWGYVKRYQDAYDEEKKNKYNEVMNPACEQFKDRRVHHSIQQRASSHSTYGFLFI